jgi:DNA-binding beta-propeller fold protein YncE
LSLVSGRRAPRRQVAVVLAVFALAFVGLFAIATSAHASELLYWDNYSADPDSVSVANIDGSGGGSLNLAGVELNGPEGMAYDSATGRLYVATLGRGLGDSGQVVFINVDGSGAGVFSVPGVPVEVPKGLALDPVTRIIYWNNTKSDTISWAKLDGSAGGVLTTAGATVDSVVRMAIDPVAGRLYWGNSLTSETSSISFANANNTGGGGNLDLTGATPPESISGLAVDPVGGRLYLADQEAGALSYANLDGSGGGDIDLTGAFVLEPYGLALDPTLGKLYWGNYDQGSEEREGAIGFANVGGGGGGIDIATAPTAGPQDPVILKGPTGASVPTVTRDAKLRSHLTCSQGTWAGDFSGSNVYRAPHTFAYQWAENGVPIPGATAATLDATKGGAYTCAVTASNQAGSASQTSAAIQLNAATLKLTVKKKARVKKGGVATFKVEAVNLGDVKSANSKVCVKVPKKAKKALKAPKCKKLGQLEGGGTSTAKLKFKVRKSARGTYKVTFQLRGSAGKSAQGTILVSPPKKK